MGLTTPPATSLRTPSVGTGLLGRAAVAVAALLHGIGGTMPAAAADAEPAVAADAADADADTADTGVFLPVDREKERLLDRARRLIGAAQWGDAVSLLDELLADDRDAFMVATGHRTRRSIRAEAVRLVEELPAAGREAYALVFRGRAERALAEAIVGEDAAAIAAVARRWSATPAGRRACAIAAQLALEADDPWTAEAWAERLATAGEPAWEPAIEAVRDAAASSRSGGSPASAADPPGVGHPAAAASGPREWAQPRGDAARNAIVDASRPLLAPRYRVPLTVHPEEARLLEGLRRAAVAEGLPGMPAGMPVAVGRTVVVQVPTGILGVDFDTGRRLWMRSAVEAARDPEHALGRRFDDATSGGLSSDGVRVFAVECHPDALTPADAPAGFGGAAVGTGGWRGGNTLSAYDVAAPGEVAWRLPRRPPGDGADAGAPDWFMAAPLVAGGELFVLVESQGRIRLDVLDARDGRTLWTQPLADLEERQSVAAPDAFARRLAGLAPALGGGVLVCPLGGGTVVGFDLATRTLLWAHSSRIAPGAGDAAEPAGARPRPPAAEPRVPSTHRGGDPWPVIAAGRVFLASPDSDEVVCLRLRDGAAAWRQPFRGRRQIAGVVDGSLVLVGGERVDAVAADTGLVRWTRPLGAGEKPSGRGLLTRTRLFLPVDSPGVLEIDLATGEVAGRHAARGGSVPGNLVAFRGEIISRGLDFLDVFHQSAELETKVETASRDGQGRDWTDYWAGQLALDAGDVADGLARIRAAARSPLVPASAVADALVFGLGRDFAAAVAAWRSWEGDAARSPAVLRLVIDGSLRAGDDATARLACRGLEARAAGMERDLVRDPRDAALEVDAGRWLAGRLAELATRSGPASPGAAASDGARAAVDPAEPAADPAAREWPLGRVSVRTRQHGGPGPPMVVGGHRLPVPLVAGCDPSNAGLSITYDPQHRRLGVADGFGRRLVEPLRLDIAPEVPWSAQPSSLEPAVVGRVLVVRSAGGVAAFDLAADAGDGRVLWSRRSRPAVRGLVMLPSPAGGRRGAEAGTPLAARIAEPDDPAGSREPRAPAARAGGVLVPEGRTITALDPTSGRVLWEREGLPRVVDWIADDEAACGCTADGRGSPVLSMCDGRLLRLVDLPPRRRRLASVGRRLVAATPLDGEAASSRVRLDRIDPLRDEPLPLGEFAGDARGLAVGDGRFAVLAADGTLSMIDVDAGRLAWATPLPACPQPVDEVRVIPWRDRYLVFAGMADLGRLEDSQPSFAEPAVPLSGCIWAIDRDDGRRLWNGPATVRRAGLAASQPADLPVLVFILQPAADRAGLREMHLLCLDKRTGHAVADDLRLPLRGAAAAACEVVGDPRGHAVSIRAGGGAATTATLTFTGEPLSPQPPFRAAARKAATPWRGGMPAGGDR